jgi:hypothetical protein
LEKLERGATFLIERSNFAVEDEVFGRQQLQGIENQRPIAIVFDFVEPIAFRQLLDRKCLHRFNERGRFYLWGASNCGR